MSLKSLKKISFIALVILSLGAVFLFASIFNASTNASGVESGSEQLSNEKTGTWVENSLYASDITKEEHYGVECMVIDTADDLGMVAYMVGQGADTDFINGNFYLAADIDLGGKLWTPIGTTANPFNGVFFGNGHTISNITIAQASHTEDKNLGLFGVVTGSIVDLKVAGSFSLSQIIDQSEFTIGAVVGSLKGNGQVINCVDQSSQSGSGQHYSIGSSLSTTKVIYASSLDGKTPLFSSTTKANMQSTISFAGDAQTGYSTYFATGVEVDPSAVEGVGAGFYSNGNYSLGSAEESQQVRVAYSDVTSTGYSGVINVEIIDAKNSDENTNNIPLYSIDKPVLREDATGAKVYALRTGYKAVIGEPSLSEDGIVTLEWQEATITVSYDYGYGSRTKTISGVGYDSPWNVVVANNPIERQGFTNQTGGEQSYTLYADADKDSDKTLNLTALQTYSTYYAADGNTVYMGWQNPKSNLTGLLYFGADQNEGGVFVNSNANNAISDLSVSGAEMSARESNCSELTQIVAGQDVVISFTLKNGYTFQEAGVGSNLTTRTGWQTASAVTNSNKGSYTFFPNSTGMDAAYTVGNSGYYDAYTPIAIDVKNQQDEDKNNIYTITIKNIVDLGGEIVLLFGREEKSISIEGTGLDHVEDAEIGLKNNSTQTSLNWEAKTISTKIGESFDLVISSTGDYYILSSTVEGFACEVTEGTATTVGGNNYYQQKTFAVDSFTPDLGAQNFVIKLDVNMLLTYITVQIGDNGQYYQTNNVPEGKRVAVVATSGHISERVLEKNTFQVSMTAETTLAFAENGYFEIESVLGASVPPENGSITQTFTTFSGDATQPAYVITFYPEKLTYGVNIKYTLDGQELDLTTAQKFVSFEGEVTALDYNQTYTYTLTLAQNAATWLGYTVGVVGSDLGSNTTGWQASKVGNSGTGQVSGTFAEGQFQFTYAPGTYNSTLTINLTRKEMTVNFTGLVLNSNKSPIPNTNSVYGSFTVKYDASGTGSLVITSGSGLSSIAIENGYYLLGWYLSNGKTVNTFSSEELLKNGDFTSFVAEKAAAANGSTAVTITVNPLVEKRTITLSYAHGLTDTAGLTDATEISAPTYAYGDSPVSLRTEKYKNIGYSFAEWTSERGTINNHTFSLIGNDWNLLWEGSAASTTHTWTGFAATDEEKSRSITLTATFTAVQYRVSIDSSTTLEISIGQTIKFEAKTDYATYTNQESTQSVNGVQTTGHTPVGFTIDGNSESAAEQTGLSTFTLSLDNIKALIAEANFYQAAESAELSILTEFEANVYKLYIQTNPNNYYTVTLKQGTLPEQGGTDSTGTYVNVTYGSKPANLSQVQVERSGYIFGGYTLAGQAFDAEANYTLTQNSTLVPVFTRDPNSTFVKNRIVLTETEAFTTPNKVTGEKYEFYYDASYYLVVEGLNLVTTNYANRTFPNGDSEVAARFYTTKDVPSGSFYGDKNVLPYQDLFNVFQREGYPNTLKLSYVVLIRDGLTNETYNLVFDLPEISMIKNEIKISDIALKSYYTGTADYLAAPGSSFGTIIGSKYDINGNEKTKQDMLGQTMEQEIEKGNHEIIIVDSTNNFSVKAGYGFKLDFGISGHFESWYNHIEEVSGDNFVIFSTGLEIVKSVAEIEFKSSSALYADGLVQTVAQNVTNGTFNVEGNSKYKFTYSFDKLTLVSNQIGVYTGSGDPTADQEKFAITGLKITLNGVDVTSNFDWAISPNSTFEVLGGEGYTVKEFRYSSRYQSASNGALTALTTGWGEGGRQNTFTISNITYGGSPVVINNKSQYSHVVDETVVFTIIGNGSYSLAVLVNQDAIGSNALTYNVTVSSPLEPTLALIAWQNNENTIGGDLFGTTLPNATISQTYSSDGQENTYAVFTDVVKVSVDFNLSGLDPQTQTLFVSSAGHSLANPSDNSGELEFGGYQISGSGLEVTGGQGSTSLKTTSAGTTATLKAKWNLTENVDISIIEGKETITISPLGTPDSFTVTGIFEENLVHASLIGEPFYAEYYQVYKIEAEGDIQLEKKSFPATRAIWPYLNEAGLATFDNTGKYKIVITYEYDDTIQGVQTKTKELYFNISVVKDVFEINNMTTDNPSLTFANRALDQEVSFSFTNISYDDWEGRHENEGSSTISQIAQLEQYLSVATVYYNADPSQQLTWENAVAGAVTAIPFYIKITTPYPEDSNGNAFFNAGEYSVQFVLWNIFTDYVTLQAAESASLTQTIEIDQYTIDLSSYNNQIDPGKLVGMEEPSPITDTITIAENQNDSVTLSFDRTEGESAGLYPLSNPQIVDEMDENNYDLINVIGFDADFSIANNENGRLVITVPNGLHFTYDGQAVDGFDLVYSEGKFLLQALRSMAVVASTEVQVRISVADEGGSWREYEIAEEARDDIANTISVAFASGTSATDYLAEGYALSVTLTNDDFQSVGFSESSDGSFYIDQRPLTLNKVEKVFDGQTDFEGATIDFTGYVVGESLTITGAFAAAGAGQQALTGLGIGINGEKSTNYVIANPEFMGTITPAEVTKVEISVANASNLVYGQIGQDTSLEQMLGILGQVTISINDTFTYQLTSAQDQWLSIESITPSGTGIYSTALKLKVGNQTLTFVFASTNFTGLNGTDSAGRALQVEIKTKTLDLSSTVITKPYDGTMTLPSNISWQGLNIESGDLVEIDAASAYEKNYGSDLKVTIVLSGADKDNYAVTDNVKGSITQTTVQLQIDCTQNLPNDNEGAAGFIDGDKEIVNGSEVISVAYPFAESADLDQILNGWLKPERVGYQVTGYSYKTSTGSFETLTKDNLAVFIESVITKTEGAEAKVYPNWQRRTYDVTINGANLASITQPSGNLTAGQGDISTGSATYTILYYEDFSLTVNASAGYKITEFAISGTYTSKLEAGIGSNSAKISVVELGGDLTIDVTAQSVSINFVIDKAIPQIEGVEIVETSSTWQDKSVVYAEIGQTTLLDFLPKIVLTDGTYLLVGFGNGEHDITLASENRTLKDYIDQIYSVLDGDKTINLTAMWQGESYTIHFDAGQGGTFAEGENFDATAVFGGDITLPEGKQDFPVPTRQGMVFFYQDKNGKTYTKDTLFSTIDPSNEVTFTAQWSYGEFDLTIVIDPHLTVRKDGVNLTEKTYKIFNDETWQIEIIADAGYSFSISSEQFYGTLSGQTSPVSISGVYAASTLHFVAVPNENALTLNYDSSKVASIDFKVDSEEFEGEELKFLTDTTVQITITAGKGFKFNANAAVLSGSGKIEQSISENESVLTITWSGFTADATITVRVDAKPVTITFDQSLSDYASELSINQTSALQNGRYQTLAGQTLHFELILKYGYQNAKLTTEAVGVTISHSEIAGFNPDQVWVVSGTISGLTEDFTLALDVTNRTYTVTVSVEDYGEETRGSAAVSPDGENNLEFDSFVTLSATVSNNDYRFIGWYLGQELISDSAEYKFQANEESSQILKAGNLAFQARFDYNSQDYSFSSGSHGQLEVEIYGANDELTQAFVVEAETTQNITLFVGTTVKVIFHPDQGYEIDKFMAGEQDFTEEIADGIYSFNVDPKAESTFVASFKASEVFVDVKVAVQINFTNYQGLEVGGKLYIVDEHGDQLAEENYLTPSEGELNQGINYQVRTYTDQVFYLWAEANSGYSFSLSVEKGAATIDQITASGKTIYKISQAQNLSLLQGVFRAEEQRVEVSFVTVAEEGKTTAALAGRILMDETASSAPTSPSGNNSEKFTAVVLTGGTLKLNLSTNFNYSMVAEEGNVKLLITGDGATITPGEVVDNSANLLTTGFTYTSSLTISNISSDITIKIVAEPIKYKVQFYIDDEDAAVNPNQPVTLENVVYGQPLDLSSLSEEDLGRLKKTKQGFGLTGYYTKQLGQGTQYFDRNLVPLRDWLESPYIQNGTVYVANDNYDPETMTFTLYGAWPVDQAMISIDFIPPSLKQAKEGLSLSDIIVNIEQTTVWIKPDDIWTGQFSANEDLNLQLLALEFEGFKFSHWAVINLDSEEITEYSSKELTISSVEKGRYLIQAVYLPYFTMEIESNNAEDPSLVGEAYLMQNGQRVSGDTFDSTVEVVLVAKANPGYSFLYWKETDGDIYPASSATFNNGRYEYNLGIVDRPLYLTARFQGEEVGMKVDLSQFQQGKVLQVFVNDKEIDLFEEEFTVQIGDKVEMKLSTDDGYGIEFAGANFALDPATGLYKYIASAQHLEEGSVSHSGIIVIRPISIQKQISFTFDFLVDGAPMTDVVADDVTIRFTYRLGTSIVFNDVVERDSVIEGLLFGGTITLNISPSTNYKVQDIVVSLGQASQSVMEVFADGRVDISSDILAILFQDNQPYKITIDFTRMVWSDEDSRSQQLAGNGTQQEPYLITSEKDMGFVAWAVNNGITNQNGELYANCHYRLTADLDFKGKYWEPIGTGTNPFNGVMDLADYSIENTSFYQDYTNPSPSYNGLFWVIGDDAVIMQTNNALWIALSIAGGVILLALIFILAFVIARKRKKKKFDELANG